MSASYLSRRITKKEGGDMPRTRKPKPEPIATPRPQPGLANCPPAEVMNLSEAAAYLRLPDADVLRLVTEQALPGRRLGNEWRFLKAAIQDWLRSGTPTAKGTKEAWLSVAGSCKDDPDLEKIVEEAYRNRGRPITEDGSYKNFSH
jgi:excisionase family DNA binding protein